MSKANKQFVQKAQELLKERGHEIPIGHLYEVFARLGGFKDWNTASAADVRFGVNSFTPLREGEMKIVNSLIELQKKHDEKMRKRKIIRVTAEGKAWVKFDADYFVKEGAEITDELIAESKKLFLEEIDQWEAKAPKDVAHITVQMETAYGYHELEPGDIEAEVENASDRIDHRLGLGKFTLPSLDQYQAVADGLYKRQGKLDAGIITFPSDDNDNDEVLKHGVTSFKMR